MKRIIIALVAAKFAIFGSTGVSAGFYSGKGVIANCNSEANYDKGWCAGYLGSWADGDIDMVRRKACIPSDTSIGTLKKVLMDYADANPQEVEAMNGGELLQRAFSRKWPIDSTDDSVSEIFRKTYGSQSSFWTLKISRESSKMMLWKMGIVHCGERCRRPL